MVLRITIMAKRRLGDFWLDADFGLRDSKTLSMRHSGNIIQCSVSQCTKKKEHEMFSGRVDHLYGGCDRQCLCLGVAHKR